MSRKIRAIIVADTGPLIALAKINHLSILSQLYQQIKIPETVFAEATINSNWRDSQQIDSFVQEKAELCADLEMDQVEVLLQRLDAGESQAIALADSLRCPVLLDERRGRIVAKQLQIDIVGTIGLLLTAKQEGLIPEIAPLLQAMTKNGYRLAPALIKQALVLAGEKN
jgi:predicted nucleic acid-binding protein